MKKVGVFGHSGFLGHNLIQYLYNYQLFPIDIRNKNWETYIDEVGLDAIINLIGKAHDHKNEAKEADFYFANYEILKQIFEKFKTSELKLLIHISSIAAVEEVECGMVIDEDYNANPKSHYGKSKRKAEDFLLSQVLEENKKVIILRPTMVHGIGDKGNLRLLFNIISKGIPYPFGKYKNKRSFLGVENFCFFIDQILKKEMDIPSGIYNVADDLPLSTTAIITFIGKTQNKIVRMVSVPKFVVKSIALFGDLLGLPINSTKFKKLTSNLVVSNQKIKAALGIEKLPHTAEEGLIKTIKSFLN